MIIEILFRAKRQPKKSKQIRIKKEQNMCAFSHDINLYKNNINIPLENVDTITVHNDQ